ncbi:MAG: hypothetical protein ACP5I2_07765, partial [Fervidicoccaceae archaeon]
ALVRVPGVEVYELGLNIPRRGSIPLYVYNVLNSLASSLYHNLKLVRLLVRVKPYLVLTYYYPSLLLLLYLLGRVLRFCVIVEMILKIMGRDQRSIVYGKPRPGEDRRYAMECGKIKSLGWRPEITLEEGLRKTVKWYLDNEWWWKAIVDERYVLAESPWG